MTTFTWVVNRLVCYPTFDGHDNVVTTVHWRVNGVDGNDAGTVYGTCNLPGPDANFILYENLTLNDVLGWIWANGVDKDASEANVQQQIDTLKNPPLISPAIPWV